jgi:AhpD family alkylhydroperoxidase
MVYSVFIKQRRNMMKFLSVLTFALAMSFSAAVFADGKGHPILTPMEPKAAGGAYTNYLMSQPEFAKKSGFDAKTFQLVSLSAAVGMKCEYCILAHSEMAKKAGATDEQIKTVVMMAANVAINSIVLYGNQYDINALRKMFGK